MTESAETRPLDYAVPALPTGGGGRRWRAAYSRLIGAACGVLVAGLGVLACLFEADAHDTYLYAGAFFFPFALGVSLNLWPATIAMAVLQWPVEGWLFAWFIHRRWRGAMIALSTFHLTSTLWVLLRAWQR